MLSSQIELICVVRIYAEEKTLIEYCQRVECCYQSNFFISQVLTQSLIKFYLQNLDQASTSKSEPNISIWTKLKLQKLVLWPNFSFQICNKLLSTSFPASTSATVTTSTSFELASSHARVTSIKFTKQQSGSQSDNNNWIFTDASWCELSLQTYWLLFASKQKHLLRLRWWELLAQDPQIW